MSKMNTNIFGLIKKRQIQIQIYLGDKKGQKKYEYSDWFLWIQILVKHLSCIICQMSRVWCHMSCVTRHTSHTFVVFLDKVVKIVIGGSVINGTYFVLCPCISIISNNFSNFHQTLSSSIHFSNVQPFAAISSYFQPFLTISSHSSHFQSFQPCPAMSSNSSHFQPFSANSSHFSHFQPCPVIPIIFSHLRPF